MQISIEVSAKERLEAVLEWVGKRAEDKAHENNGDVIADFIEKFIVIELKRLENKNETISQDIEIPDEVVIQPLLAMKNKMVEGFDEFLLTKGITTPQSGGSTAAPATGNTVSQTATAPPPSTGGTSPRNGNGHVANIKRKLNDTEKDEIRADFLRLNGEYEDSKKSCTVLLPHMGSEITVWQITGFVSFLHREIASNNFSVPDMDSYMKFLENHKKLWAQYNSPKYKNLRAGNPMNTPKFTKSTFPQKTV